MKTKAGKLTVQEYDDGIAKGIQILMNGNVITAVDVLEDSGETRLLVYSIEDDEPDFITLEVQEETSATLDEEDAFVLDEKKLNKKQEYWMDKEHEQSLARGYYCRYYANGDIFQITKTRPYDDAQYYTAQSKDGENWKIYKNGTVPKRQIQGNPQEVATDLELLNAPVKSKIIHN